MDPDGEGIFSIWYHPHPFDLKRRLRIVSKWDFISIQYCITTTLTKRKEKAEVERSRWSLNPISTFSIRSSIKAKSGSRWILWKIYHNHTRKKASCGQQFKYLCGMKTLHPLSAFASIFLILCDELYTSFLYQLSRVFKFLSGKVGRRSQNLLWTFILILYSLLLRQTLSLCSHFQVPKHFSSRSILSKCPRAY